MGGDPISEMFSLVFDDRKKMPTEMPTSNICFSLYHPKVHVDRASCWLISGSPFSCIYSYSQYWNVTDS
jgi:hypothetical protein